MLLSLFLVCVVALGIALGLLFALGARVRVASRLAGFALVVVLAAVSGEIAGAIWEQLPTSSIRGGQAVVLAFGLLVVLLRPAWNPIGQAFFAVFLASAASYLWFGVETTFGDGLSPMARVASAVLLLFEVIALTLSGSFTFESCDAICRVRHTRRLPERDAEYFPMISLHVAAYNEPPDMLIETIQSLEGLDYPNYEIVVIDNNTKDPDVWQPVEEYCRDRPLLNFVHVDPWPGFKSGALNLARKQHTHPDAEVVGIVDADYLADPQWLRALAGFFADPTVAFVQSPQDYREYEGDAYLQACYDAYKYFFVTTMPSRNERNSIIFAGTMGLVRRNALDEVGGWDEWCITEDAELSLRLLRAGYQGVFVGKSFGQGIMPLTFSSLKSQRFRWCFGGMQILRMHWRDLLPWRRTADNHLTTAQRIDYLLGSVQWMNDLVYFGFTVVLIASAAVLLGEGPLGLRPLYGAAALLPVALVATGVIRALWALRVTTGIGWRRALLAFVNWLALSWTVAIACVQGLTRREGVFLRTPKGSEQNRLLAALWSARTETLWLLVLWLLAVVIAVQGAATPFVLALLAWQGVVYASAPYMSWLNQHTELSAQLARRRRTEWLRERANIVAPATGALVGAVAAGVVALVVGIGGSNPGHPDDPFALPASDNGPSPTEQVPSSPTTSTTTGDGEPTSTTTTPDTTPDTSTPPSTTDTTTAPPTTAAP